MDYGHKKADKDLKELEKAIKEEYAKASKDMEERLNKKLEAFARRDEAQKAKVESGELTYGQYIQWREQYLLKTDTMKGIVQDLAKDMDGMSQKMTGVINDHMLDTFIENYNYGAYEVCKGADLNMSFELMDRRTAERLMRDEPKIMPSYTPKRKTQMVWNEKKIRQSLTAGIMRGDSVQRMAKDLKTVANMNKGQAIRTARTMTTGAENAGRMEAYHEAEDKGIQMQKLWIATLDDRTRDAHIELDGVAVDIDEPFVNSIGKIMFPADPDCDDPENCYNCRCTMVAQIKGYSKDLSGRQMSEKLGDMSYDEWKAQAEERTAEREAEREAVEREVETPIDVEEISPEEIEYAEIEMEDPEPAEDREDVEDYAEEQIPEDEIDDSWEARAEAVQDMSWNDMHSMFVDNEDSYIHDESYIQMEKEYQEAMSTRQALEDERKELKAELEGERTMKPREQWTEEEVFYAELLDEKPYEYTERGKEIEERLESNWQELKEASSKETELYEEKERIDGRAYDAEKREWENSAHDIFDKGDPDKDYDGFSTTMRIGQFDEDLKNGIGFIAEMTPDEYLERISMDIFHTSYERTTSCYYENVKEYARQMASGVKFDMGYIDYEKGGQEGRHRAMSAKILGIEKIPVYIRGTPR